MKKYNQYTLFFVYIGWIIELSFTKMLYLVQKIFPIYWVYVFLVICFCFFGLVIEYLVLWFFILSLVFGLWTQLGLLYQSQIRLNGLLSTPTKIKTDCQSKRQQIKNRSKCTCKRASLIGSD